MSDRTAVQLRIAAHAPEETEAILDLIEEYDLYLDSAAPSGTLVIGETYQGLEVRCGSSSEIAQALIARAPGAAFEVWEDPAYEWLGDIYRHTPELGLWSAECDANSVPLLRADEVLALLTSGADRTVIEERVGKTHEHALEQMIASPRPAVAAP